MRFVLMLAFCLLTGFSAQAETPAMQPYKVFGTVKGHSFNGKVHTRVGINVDDYEVWDNEEFTLHGKVEIVSATKGILTTPTGQVIDVRLEACELDIHKAQNCDASYF